jgi:hypothetical protein
MTFDLFAWLSADQARYVAVSQIGVFAFALVVAAGACSERFAAFLSTRRGTVAFCALTCFALCASRWPSIFMGLEVINRDQADFIAAAITALHHPIPWRDFDPQTSGPFNAYVLMPPALVGQTPSFFTTSILTLAMQALTIVALYGALERCFDARIARLGIVAPVVFLCVTLRQEFIQYNTETLSALLCTTALWLLAGASRRGYPVRAMAAIGILCGTMPFAKLQAAPLAGTVVLACFALLALVRDLSKRERVRRFLGLAIGLAFVPSLLLAVVVSFGAWHDFWTSYVSEALAYMSLPAYQPPSYVFAAGDLGRYVDFLFAVTFVGAIAARAKRNALAARDRATLGIAVAIVLASLYAIFAPRRGTIGYLYFAIFPAATAAGAALGVLTRAMRVRYVRATVSLAFIVAALGIDGSFGRAPNFWASYAYPIFRNGGAIDPLVTMIRAHLDPGERMAIWGFQPEYNIYSQTLMGTRDPNCFFQYSNAFNPNRDYYRARFIADMVANHPEGFLDAGTASFDRDGTSRNIHEAWAELSAIVDRDYVLVGQWHRDRFYIRRDLAHRNLPSISG